MKNDTTPVMRQYSAIKAKHPDCLLLFQMGDFYELFFEDAKTAAEILGITLTRRGTHLGEEIPMCGLPLQSSDKYLSTLVKSGRKVAICDQLETAQVTKQRGPKEVIKREITRIITPGTIIEDQMLEGNQNHFLASLASNKGELAIAWVDISTDIFCYSKITRDKLEGELARLAPRELLIPDSLHTELADILAKFKIPATKRSDNFFDVERATRNLMDFYHLYCLDGVGHLGGAELSACGSIIEYLRVTQKQQSFNISLPKEHFRCELLEMDRATRQNLEITDSPSGTSLLKSLDHTKTRMGSRLLRHNLSSPLAHQEAINRRLQLVDFFLKERALRGKILQLLSLVPDVERSIARLSMNSGKPMDLHNIKIGLSLASNISGLLSAYVSKRRFFGCASKHYRDPVLQAVSLRAIDRGIGLEQTCDDSSSAPSPLSALMPASAKFLGQAEWRSGEISLKLTRSNKDFSCKSAPECSEVDIHQLLSYNSRKCDLGLEDVYVMLTGNDSLVREIDVALVDRPQGNKREGGYIKPSYHPDLNRLQNLLQDNNAILSSLRDKYKRITGISNLKIGFNNLIGYFVEVPSGMRIEDQLFMHRQNLANSVRYKTAELQSLEDELLSAKEKILCLEIQTFERLCSEVHSNSRPILMAAHVIAQLDVYTCLAMLAEKRHYCMPVIDDSFDFIIKEGRHPVVEVDRDFIPNDTEFDRKTHIYLLTGPNMSGKSTFLRQNALIAIMAQMGSFVPASSAKIGCVDKIFSRVGAADQIALGKSTFMVEMLETSIIVNQSTNRSLVILDEVGRGTALNDGLALAWSILEYIHEVNCCRTVFATHYHELCGLESQLKFLSCYRVSVKVWRDEVIFMHKIEKGVANLSFGIYVAKMAGIPDKIIRRAEQLLEEISSEGCSIEGADL